MHTLKEMYLKDKKVLLRCDYNVPIKDGVITDNSRIKASLKTIQYLKDNNCKIIILSHLGRVKTEEDKYKNTLKPVAQELSNLLNEKVYFIDSCDGDKVIDEVNNAQGIVLLENTRITDVPEKRESDNDLGLAKFWASLGDVFVNDAFGTLHRAHSSTAGIAKFIPSAIGLLVEEELNKLDILINDTPHPFTVFMGGAKVDDKLPIIKSMLDRCDYLLVGGGIANSFLKVQGEDIGDSLVTDDEEILAEVKEMLEEYKDKIVLPVDFVKDGSAIYDVGEKTIELYTEYFNKSEIIFVNGTCGKYEDDQFAGGTKAMFEALKKSDKKVIIGGGDTSAAAYKFGYGNDFYHISTGGGATLEYIANKTLTALEWLK